jgi:hypothetical protein
MNVASLYPTAEDKGLLPRFLELLLSLFHSPFNIDKRK